MKATIRLKSFPDHAGIPGHQGGSLPKGESESGSNGKGLYNQLFDITRQLRKRYAIVLPYKGKDTPFFSYIIGKGVIYLERLTKDQYGEYQKLTYKVRPDNTLQNVGLTRISDELKDKWIEEHKTSGGI